MAADDRDSQVFEDFHAKLRRRIRALITDDLIAEHERSPLGQHSDVLERVLAYFRQLPVEGKYLIVATRPWEEYRIAALSGRRGEPARLLEDEDPFPTEEAAMHGVFVRRIRDLED